MPDTLDIVSIFALGIFGTGHCVGMCGPLVLALPGHRGRLPAHLFYHLGRISTYTLVGACLGIAGAVLGTQEGAVAHSPGPVARIQLICSLVAAVVLVLLGLVRLGVLREPRWMAMASPTRLPGFRHVQARAFRVGDAPALILFGALLGLLPCGLSYAAFVRALPAGGALPGALLLAAFGIGTLPGLLLVGGVASQVARRHSAWFNLGSGLLLLGMAASLLVDALAAWL
ncbi:sulfite exporter TauE/SafE family protein [Myxococcota bacterium]